VAVISSSSLMGAGRHSIDRPIYLVAEPDGSPVIQGLVDECGDELGGAGRTVGLDVAVADGLAGQFGDAGRDEVGVGGGVVHVLAGAIAVEPVTDVEVLLEVVPEREV